MIKLACLRFFELEDSPAASVHLLSIIGQQRSEGAFPSQLDTNQWGMRETVRNTLLLLKMGLPPAGVNVDSAVRLVLRHQCRNGGWCENPALALPPDQTWLSGQRNITWLTADAIDLLRQVGLGTSAARQSALSWFRTMQDQHGAWPSLGADVSQPPSSGDPDATSQITFLMGDVYGDDDPTHQRGRACFERHLDQCARDASRGHSIGIRDGERNALDVYHLTHLLLSWWLDPPRRFRCRYNASDPRANTIMESLLSIQRPDGGWRPFFSQESSPLYTLLAVKALVLSGMLPRGDLRTSAARYAISRLD